ncbi:SDR family NAD(P)-dependent oxidoreductase [Mycolicibacterium sp.]|uniref:SDR family NAD(P)-dependent oxidoreductase n=1 Tax=Mycolicibacterium sp. TaxID=2320850 RepID=UPI001A339066|nr:SDR family NAD(P)-dependent oxidoreductase [Mycolicibacterium sp.]MBJ7336770.1 SDR family NAD(P)-dependent oxidoreductase [Mycolicibacterium sp.]
MRLNEVSALVTGGGSGLGLATASALATRGARVVIVDLASSKGAKAAEDLGATFLPADILDTGALTAAFDAAAGAGPLRAVVHCAGRGGDRLRILDRDGHANSLDSFEAVLRTNLVGTYNVLRLAAERMACNDVLADGDRGAIVLTASAAAFDGQIGQTSYSASKAGVHGMTLVAARDLASKQIRVNTIAPGLFDTAMLGRLEQEVRNRLASGVPHPHRLGSPDEYGRMACELLENTYVNGETVRLDGALRMAPR